VKTDDQPTLFVSGPLEQAISALKDHMKALEKKGYVSRVAHRDIDK
jgi:hypothetical protein